MRGGLRGFAVFIACIALGVAAIAGVGSFARSLGDGLAREGRVILGGDVSFSLMPREASDAERAFLDGQRPALGRRHHAGDGARRTARPRWSKSRRSTASIRFSAGFARSQRANLRRDVGGARRQLWRGRRPGAARAAQPRTRRAHHRRRGDASSCAPCCKSEPDKLAGGIGFGPRLLISEAALRATGLVQPGSLVRWHYRLRIPGADANDRAAASVVAAAETRLPDAGWEVRTRANASPALGRNIERFTQYLTLVGLTALLVGGVGVANAVKHYLDQRREVIATLKSLGATGGRVFAIYLVEVMLLAAIGTAIGLVDRRDPAVRDRGGVRRRHAAADRAGAASRRALLRGALRLPHRARLRALAARPRPRRAGLGALSRRRRARAPLSAPAATSR